MYCVEEVDNGPNLAELVLPADVELRVEVDPLLRIPAIVGQGVRASLIVRLSLYHTAANLQTMYDQSDSVFYVE